MAVPVSTWGTWFLAAALGRFDLRFRREFVDDSADLMADGVAQQAPGEISPNDRPGAALRASALIRASEGGSQVDRAERSGGEFSGRRRSAFRAAARLFQRLQAHFVAADGLGAVAHAHRARPAGAVDAEADQHDVLGVQGLMGVDPDPAGRDVADGELQRRAVVFPLGNPDPHGSR